MLRQLGERCQIPAEQIILLGQSCGGWGPLEAAAWTYPTVGGIIAFAQAYSDPGDRIP
jgi:hypothetical protein